jgi:ABC-type uncharacterized transport system involved in gliding motility auxiliary subunit
MNKAINLLGWVGTAAVVMALGLRFQTFKPEWIQYSWYAAMAGLVLVLLYMASQWREVSQTFSHRQTRLGTIAATSVVLVLGILVALNYLASRRNHRWDLTAGKQFSVADQTRNILQKLDAPVKVLVFDKASNFDTFRDRLDEYEYLSNRKLTAEYVDPVKDPVRANQHKVQSFGTAVFTYKDRTETVVGTDEQQLTNTLIKVLSGAQRTVYFLQGHGEHDTAGSEREGYSTIYQALGTENYKTDTLALAQKPEVPADATVLVIAGPRTDLLQGEVDPIKQYLDRGGKLLVMLDPPDKVGQAPLANLVALLKDWGIEAGTDVVVDTSGVGQLLGANEVTPVAVRYPAHPIVERFRVITAYPLARSIRPVQGGTNGRTAQTFVESSPQSWGETNTTDLFAQKPIGFDKDKDVQGPVSLAAAVSVAAPKPPAAAAPELKPASDSKTPASDAPKPETRVAAIGDSDFASNGWLGVQGNRDLFLNTVSWLSQQENLISIRPRDPEDRRLTLSAQAQRNVALLAWLGIPGAIFALGIFGWTRRRG